MRTDRSTTQRCERTSTDRCQERKSGQVIRIFSFPTEEHLTLIGRGDAALQNRIDGESTKGLLFTFSSVKALQREGSLMSAISWRSGRIDRVCRSATCAETRAIVDLEGELFALQYQWSKMLGNSAIENSPDEMARPIPGACVTDSKGLYDEMQHTVITPKGKECRVDIEYQALKEGLETSSTKFFFWVHSGAQLGNGPTKDTETEPFASSLKNGQRWRVIFDILFVSSKKRGAAGINTL